MIYTAKIKYWILFLVANLAMCGMHTISVLVGLAFHQFIPRLATQIIAIVLFWLLGSYSIFTGSHEFHRRRIRKNKGLKETSTESEDERAELEKQIQEQEEYAKKQSGDKATEETK